MAILKNVIVNNHLYAGEIFINDNDTAIPIRKYFLRNKGSDTKVVNTIVDEDTGTSTTTNGWNVPTVKAVKEYIDAALGDNALESVNLSITDKSSTNISVGSKSGSYYPLSASLTGTVTTSKSGWFSKLASFSAEDSSVIVGRIAASTTGSATANTSASAALVLDPGKQTTISAGYYPSDRIIRASIADIADESVSAGSPTFTSKDIDCSTHSFTYNSTSGKYEFTSGSVAVDVSFASSGWIDKSGVSGVIDFKCNDISKGAFTGGPSITTKPTITPAVNINAKSTYGFTTTKPSGTNGTNYLTIDPGASVTTSGVASATSIATSTGYIESGQTGGSSTCNITASEVTIAGGTNYYVPVVTPSYTDGSLAASIKSSSTSATSNGLSITDTDTDPGSGVYISTSGKAIARASHGECKVTNTAGVISARTNAKVCSGNSKDSSETTLSANKYYVTELTIPAGKTFDKVELTYGVDGTTNRTHLKNLIINGYTSVDDATLSGIVEKFTVTGGYFTELNLSSATSYINNLYGTGYIKTLSGSTLAKYTNTGTLTSFEGSGPVTNYKSTGTITNMTGSRTITNLGSSSSAGGITITNNGYSSSYKGTITVTTNTNGTVNVWNAGNDKGVQVANHTVKVDGTTVTNSSGDLITASPTFDGGVVTSNAALANSQTNATLSSTDISSGIKITATSSGSSTKVTYTNTAGWLSAHTNAQALAAKTSAGTANSAEKYLTALTIGSGKTLNNITFSGGSLTTLSGFGTITNFSGNLVITNNGIDSAGSVLTIKNNGSEGGSEINITDNKSTGTVNINRHGGVANIEGATTGSTTTYKASGQTSAWTITQDSTGNLVFTY